jgi:hypothetical protein
MKPERPSCREKQIAPSSDRGPPRRDLSYWTPCGDLSRVFQALAQSQQQVPGTRPSEPRPVLTLLKSGFQSEGAPKPHRTPFAAPPISPESPCPTRKSQRLPGRIRVPGCENIKKISSRPPTPEGPMPSQISRYECASASRTAVSCSQEEIVRVR